MKTKHIKRITKGVYRGTYKGYTISVTASDRSSGDKWSTYVYDPEVDPCDMSSPGHCLSGTTLTDAESCAVSFINRREKRRAELDLA